jgi:hypothetical protein
MAVAKRDQLMRILKIEQLADELTRARATDAVIKDCTKCKTDLLHCNMGCKVYVTNILFPIFVSFLNVL